MTHSVVDVACPGSLAHGYDKYFRYVFERTEAMCGSLKHKYWHLQACLPEDIQAKAKLLQLKYWTYDHKERFDASGFLSLSVCATVNGPSKAHDCNAA